MGKTVGEALVGLLEDYGIDTVFGIPGTHSIELYRGLENSKIRHISPRHEQGGGFMADGYARLSGRPSYIIWSESGFQKNRKVKRCLTFVLSGAER